MKRIATGSLRRGWRRLIGRARVVVAALAAVGFAGCASTAPSADPVESAISARFPGRRVDGAVRTITGEFRSLPYTSEVTFLRPNLLRWEFEILGTGERVVQVFDGHNFYQEGSSGTRRLLGADEAKVLLHRAFDESVFWLELLRDPNMITEEIPDQTFDGKPAIAIQVKHRYGYLRTIYFDPDTWDLVGMDGLAYTEFGHKQRTLVFSDFTVQDGVRVPQRIETRIEGDTVMTAKQTIVFDPLPDPESFVFTGADAR